MTTASGLLYLDSSAIVKLVAAEPESAALAAILQAGGPAVASVLARVEVTRAAHRLGASRDLLFRLSEVLNRIAFIKVDDAILRQAADLEPTHLRSLDAIHLATALSLQPHLEAYVAYDRRLLAAAEDLGLDVASPT